jgi:hypothetical protein
VGAKHTTKGRKQTFETAREIRPSGVDLDRNQETSREKREGATKGHRRAFIVSHTHSPQLQASNTTMSLSLCLFDRAGGWKLSRMRRSPPHAAQPPGV